jgi:hypothetical protein
LLETDPEKARSAARQALAPYMQLDNYVNNWRRLGFGDDDLAGGGSDRFIDANVAWGDEERDPQAHPGALGRRRRPCLHPVDHPDGSRRPDEKVLAMLLAPGSFDGNPRRRRPGAQHAGQCAYALRGPVAER